MEDIAEERECLDSARRLEETLIEGQNIDWIRDIFPGNTFFLEAR